MMYEVVLAQEQCSPSKRVFIKPSREGAYMANSTINLLSPGAQLPTASQHTDHRTANDECPGKSPVGCERLPAGQDSPLVPSISPEPVSHLPQHRLLRLMAGCVDRPAASPLTRIHMGHTLEDFQASPQGVRAWVRGHQGESLLAEGSFLAGADGARSHVRCARWAGWCTAHCFQQCAPLAFGSQV